MSDNRRGNPNLYEVNTRVLLRTIDTAERSATLKDIPDDFWENLASRGIDWVWLLGVWSLREKEIVPDVIPEQMMQEFATILPDLDDADIVGSTFAIDDYTVDPRVGTEEELLELKRTLNDMGIMLMLDFIPNHFGAHTHWLRTHPEYFIEVGESAHNIDSKTFYSPVTLPGKYFAHGKDPYFDAWQDTVQVDYTFHGTREWMTEQLARVSFLCDGVRCDMAMLAVQHIFEKTWHDYVKWNGDDFWPDAIKTIKEANPDFLFLAEVYWDMEAELLELGFDYCYDKTFNDRLLEPKSLKAHFNADIWYLERTARFLENHDEERIASKLALRQHMAAAALVAFSPGMRFWHMGQWEGRSVKLPVQLNRMPVESCGCLMWGEHSEICQCTAQFYRQLYALTNREELKLGSWERISPMTEEDNTLLTWQWTLGESVIILAVNYSEEEFLINQETTGLPESYFEQLIFPKQSDAYNGLKMRPWDVRVWQKNA